MSVIDVEQFQDGSFKTLLKDTMLLTSQSLSSQQKLTLLSRLLSIFDDGDGLMYKNLQDVYRKQGEWNSLFHFVKSSLTADQNKYVTYSARKVITCLVKVHKSEDGVKILQDCLCSRTLDVVCIGLQICKELFSKKNSNHEWVLSQLGSSVITAWKVLQTETVAQRVAHNQCILEYFSVCIKLAKIAWSNKDQAESLEILQQTLKSGDEWNIFLFRNDIKVYVKRKLIQFLCFITKPCDLVSHKPLYEERERISVAIFNRLCSSDVLQILKSPGQSTFIGSCTSDCDKQDASTCCDTVHVREWTFLCFCVTAVLIGQKDYEEKGAMFLLKLDSNVKELLDKQTNLPFPWLPDIYGDQDDLWIDVMLLLMEIFSVGNDYSGSYFTDEMRNQHHLHFLQFVETLGYDHLVLLDLLTSPETNFLSYLLKYLKYLHKTWDVFKGLISNCFKQMRANESSDELSVEVCDKTEEENEIEKPEALTQNIMEEHGEYVESNSDVVSSEVTPCCCVNSDLFCVHNRSSQHSRNVLAYSSLTMIADAYDDDDDDVNDSELREGTWDKGIGEALNNEKKCLPPEQNVAIPCKDNKAYDEDRLKQIACDSVQFTDKTLTDLKDRSNFIDNVELQDFDQGLGIDNSGDSVLDKVMGMLIRTRMKLEKLSKSDLMNYNPAVLMNLIAQVEAMYEEI